MSLFLAPDTSWKVDRRSGPYLPIADKIKVSGRGPFIMLSFGSSAVPVRTPEAHKMGFALWKQSDLCIKQANDGVLYNGDFATEFVVLTINGAELHIPAGAARQLGAALLRRSDYVDEWQIEHKARIVQ